MTWVIAKPSRRAVVCAMNEDEAATVRRKIEYYRRLLAEGAEGELGRIYVAELVKLQALLDAFERGAK